MSTTTATKIAPGSLKTIGIHAGANSMIQVNAPGAASKERAPNCRRARSQAGATGGAGGTERARFWAGERVGAGTPVSGMSNKIQDLHGPALPAGAPRGRGPALAGVYG